MGCKDWKNCSCKQCKSFKAHTKLKKSLKHNHHGTRMAAYTANHGKNKVAHYAYNRLPRYFDKVILPTQGSALSYHRLAAETKTRK